MRKLTYAERTDFTIAQIREIMGRVNSNYSHDLEAPVDISDCILNCEHLSLMSGFKLLLFSWFSHHGYYGHIAGIPDNQSLEKIEENYYKKDAIVYSFKDFNYEYALDPYEVIICDDSPEALVEAYALHLFFYSVTKVFGRRDTMDLEIVDSFPFKNPSVFEDDILKWNVYNLPSNMTPYVLNGFSKSEFRFYTQSELDKNHFIVGEKYRSIDFNVISFDSAFSFDYGYHSDISYPYVLQSKYLTRRKSASCRNHTKIVQAESEPFMEEYTLLVQCNKCGNFFPTYARFCNWCGSKVVRSDNSNTVQTTEEIEQARYNKMLEDYYKLMNDLHADDAVFQAEYECLLQSLSQEEEDALDGCEDTACDDILENSEDSSYDDFLYPYSDQDYTDMIKEMFEDSQDMMQMMYNDDYDGYDPEYNWS